MNPARLPVLVTVAAVATFLVACGHKIGDECNIASDCEQDGTRVCDNFSSGGYCTIQGCDFGTCPSEATCVRFFPGLENAQSCKNPDGNPDQSLCTSDQICTVLSECAPRSIEQRFCMATCSSDGDCRDGYECRHVGNVHGGEPVPDPNDNSATVPNVSFCASRRSCSLDTDCETGEHCDITNTKVCLPN